MAITLYNFPRYLQQILDNTEKIMATLDDLNAAVSAIQAAIQTAITLIESLHKGAGTVSDAEVEDAVAKLQAAATALGGAQPQP